MDDQRKRVRRKVDTIVDNAVDQAIKEQDVTTARGFFHNMMSVDEARVSVLMICLLLSLVFGGWAYLKHGEISQIWASLIETFAYCVTGINMLAALTPAGGRASRLIANVLNGADDQCTAAQQGTPAQSVPSTQSVPPAQSVPPTKGTCTDGRNR